MEDHGDYIFMALKMLYQPEDSNEVVAEQVSIVLGKNYVLTFQEIEGDVFGRIYEYFLTQFADQKAHDGGEFFTPVSLVSLIAHVLDPERGTVLDQGTHEELLARGGIYADLYRLQQRRLAQGHV